MSGLILGGTGVFDSGKVSIGSDIEPEFTLKIPDPAAGQPAMIIDRYDSTVPHIEGVGSTGYLILESDTDETCLNYFSSQDVRLAYGGGNVLMGTTSTVNVTSGSDLNIAGTIYNESYINATLLGTWTNFGAPYNLGGYWKDKNGIVRLGGLVLGGLTGSYVFTLPVGYRPEYRELQIGEGYYSGVYKAIRLDVLPDGNVYAAWPSGLSWVSLERVNFRAYQ